jgi:hypothetical protein
MEDYRKMASMAQFMVELPEEPVGTLHEEVQQNKSANEELGDFSKTVKPAKLKKLQHWLKPGSPNCKENLLKRTAKIETQALKKNRN